MLPQTWLHSLLLIFSCCCYHGSTASSCIDDAVVGFRLTDTNVNNDVGLFPQRILASGNSNFFTTAVKLLILFEDCPMASAPSRSILIKIDNDRVFCRPYEPPYYYPTKKRRQVSKLQGGDKATKRSVPFTIPGVDRALDFGVAATPFRSPDCTGKGGVTFSQHVFVEGALRGALERGTCPSSVLSFKLYNARSDRAVASIQNGDKFCAKPYPVNIQAITAPCDYAFISIEDGKEKVQSLRLILKGRRNNSRTENKAPYMLFGDDPGVDIYGRVLKPGRYELTATPYASLNASGEMGTPRTITFEMEDCGSQWHVRKRGVSPVPPPKIGNEDCMEPSCSYPNSLN